MIPKKQKKQQTKQTLKDLAAVRGLNRKDLARPRSCVFKDQTKYDRQRQNQELREEISEDAYDDFNF